MEYGWNMDGFQVKYEQIWVKWEKRLKGKVWDTIIKVSDWNIEGILVKYGQTWTKIVQNMGKI